MVLSSKDYFFINQFIYLALSYCSTDDQKLYNMITRCPRDYTPSVRFALKGIDTKKLDMLFKGARQNDFSLDLLTVLFSDLPHLSPKYQLAIDNFIIQERIIKRDSLNRDDLLLWQSQINEGFNALIQSIKTENTDEDKPKLSL